MRTLQDYLENHHVHYEVLGHHEAYTAPVLAHVLHVSGKIFAKVVIVKADDRFLMVVLPSNRRIDFERLTDVLGASHVQLATEDEFKELFPDCEIGTMPPFGNL